MKIYFIEDRVQDALDSGNYEPNSLYFSKITKDAIICPINQSVPEKKFKSINCDVATSKRKAFTIGVTEGDYCFTYNGTQAKEVFQDVLDYCIEQNPELKSKRRGLIYEDGGIAVVYAPIRDGVEFCFYGGKKFNCNYEEFNESLNTNRANCNIKLEDLITHLAKTFDSNILTELPDHKTEIKNNRGIIKSCSSGKDIFGVKKKIKNVVVPAVKDDDGTIKPQTSVMGFGSMNNCRLINNDTEYSGELHYFVQDNEDEETEEFLKQRGNAKWQTGIH